MAAGLAASERRCSDAVSAAEVLAETIPGAFEGDAHAFLMAVYKDPAQPIDLRIDAAKAAIRYEKPALAAVDVTSLGERVGFDVSAEPLSAAEWEAKFRTEH